MKWFVVCIFITTLLLSAGCSSAVKQPATQTSLPTLATALFTTPPTFVLPSVTPTSTPTSGFDEKIECIDSGHVTEWDGLDNDWLNLYFGSLDDKYPISLTLIYSGEYIEGVFFYEDQPLLMKINGCLEDGRSFTLRAYNKQGRFMATFRGEFPEIDPQGGYNSEKLERDVIIGTWVDDDASGNHSVYVRLEQAVVGTFDTNFDIKFSTDEKEMIKAAQDFLQAIENNDRDLAATIISYPLQVSIEGSVLEVKNRNEFIDNYDEIITDKFKTIIEYSIPAYIFGEWQGVMLGPAGFYQDAQDKVFYIYTKYFH